MLGGRSVGDIAAPVDPVGEAVDSTDPCRAECQSDGDHRDRFLVGELGDQLGLLTNDSEDEAESRKLSDIDPSGAEKVAAARAAYGLPALDSVSCAAVIGGSWPRSIDGGWRSVAMIRWRLGTTRQLVPDVATLQERACPVLVATSGPSGSRWGFDDRRGRPYSCSLEMPWFFSVIGSRQSGTT